MTGPLSTRVHDGVIVASAADGRIDAGFLADLVRLCLDVADDDSVRALVFGGTNTFPSEWGPEPRAELLVAADSFRAVAALAVPTIAAVEGDAFEGGAELALAFDIRIAGDRARFRFGGVASGEIPFAGGTQRLPRLVGRARALEFVLCGEPIDAATAHSVGLVQRVVPAAEALRAAEDLAAAVASRGPIGVRYTKEAILRGLEVPVEQGLRVETDLATILQSTADRAEGVRAFIEKRSPEFRGE